MALAMIKLITVNAIVLFPMVISVVNLILLSTVFLAV